MENPYALSHVTIMFCSPAVHHGKWTSSRELSNFHVGVRRAVDGEGVDGRVPLAGSGIGWDLPSHFPWDPARERKRRFGHWEPIVQREGEKGRGYCKGTHLRLPTGEGSALHVGREKE